MLKTLKHRNPIVVDLTENVSVPTTIPKDNHAALRSGFAGYPPNPRWNATKYRAWKVGCQWRNALAKGEMVVRETDSMLVAATGEAQEENSNSCSKSQFAFLGERLVTSYQKLRPGGV